jgi:hypothetical protein
VPIVPDAPIGHFHLTIFGGKHGYLADTRDICAHPPVTRVSFIGQNGATEDVSLPLKASCGGAARSKRHAHRGNGGGGR